MVVALVKIALLGTWGAFFVWIVSFGQKDLARLLHPDLWWLLICASIILFMFLIFHSRKSLKSQRGTPVWWQLPSLMIMFVPLLFFPQVQGARFNAETFSKRSIPTVDGFRQGNMLSKRGDTESQEGDVPLTDLIYSSEKYLGKEVDVVCQTLMDKRLPENTAICYRYLMNCCAADAMPIFIFLQYPEGLSIENEKWIRTKGRVSMQKNSGIEIPLMKIHAVEYVEEPPFPYLL